MQVGRRCTLNINTGTFTTPIWSPIGRVSSPQTSFGRPTARKTYRESRNSKNVLGMLDVGMTFTYIQRAATAADTILASLFNSLYTDAVLDLAALDRPAGTGAKGIRGPFAVSAMPKSEDDEDAVSYEVTVVEVTDDANPTAIADAYTMS
jgi:hypothetical protein